MSVSEALSAALASAFPDADIDIIDESHLHAGHAGAPDGGDSHFAVTILWRGFAAMSRVARHRAVNEAAAPAFDAGLHALKIKAEAPA